MDPSPPGNSDAEAGAAPVSPASAASGACPTVHCNVESKLSFKRGCKDDGERTDHYCAFMPQRSEGESIVQGDNSVW